MKHKFVWNRARKSSLAIGIFSLLVFWQTSLIKPTITMISGSDPGSRVFPYACAIILLVCSVLRFISSNEPDSDTFIGGSIGWLRMAALVAVLAAYIFLMPYIGYLVDTFIISTVLVFLMRLDQKFKVRSIIFFALILSVFLWVFFTKLIGTNLPTGSLFGNVI